MNDGQLTIFCGTRETGNINSKKRDKKNLIERKGERKPRKIIKNNRKRKTAIQKG